MMTPGERLRARRVLAGLTQAQVAEALDCSYQIIHKYETGKNAISGKVAERLAPIVGCRPAWLLFGSDDISVPDDERRVLNLMHAASGLQPEQISLLTSLAKEMVR